MDFSILIPAKNEEKYIRNCLQSISEINYPQGRFEVLLVDNGSADRTVEIAESFGAKVYVKPDLTISGLRNFAAKEAQGRALAFLDADCTVDKNWLNAASLYLESPEVVSYGSPAILPPNSTWVQRAWFNIRERKQPVEEVDWHESANVFVQSDAFESSGGFDEALITCEDYDLFVRLSVFGKQFSDNRIVAVHHREPATLEEFFRKESWRGQSNLAGLLRHGFQWRELPSLMAPVVYFICTLLSVLLCVGLMFGVEPISYSTVLVWLLFWQFPILVLAFRKGNTAYSDPLRLGLYLLLNVYLIARGRAMLRKGERSVN